MTLWDYYKSKRPRAYTDNWHLRWIAEVIERAMIERRNVVIEAPPRHSKSELCNVFGPAWRLNEVFDECFMAITNSDQLAKKFSVACRGLVEHKLDTDRDSEWRIAGTESLNYSYRASGVRGQMTGHGASVLLFDDLVKNGQEAKSDTVRESIWENVVSAAMNRLSPDGIVIAMQSRLHAQDPVGKLLELDHMNWMHLHLPAVNDGGRAWFRDGSDEVIFPPYSALWPDRYSAEKLQDIKQTVHSYYWNAQFMCEPSMGDLGYFDVNVMPPYQFPSVERCWIAVDAANTENVKGSYTAFVALGLERGRLKVLNVLRGRWRQDVMRTQLIEFYRTVTRQTGILPEKVIVERAAGGFGIIDSLGNQLPIEPVYPLGSKEERAGSVCYIVNRGQVALPQAAPWLEAFKSELQNFPLGSTKDMVDAFVHSLSYAVRPSEFRPKPMELGNFEVGSQEILSATDEIGYQQLTGLEDF